MKKAAVLLSSVLLIQFCYSQSITGSWYGRADAVAQGTQNNYLTELIIKQKGDEVEGVFAYYFKNMYKSVFVRGKYDKVKRMVIIKNIPLIHFKATASNSMDCPMDFEGTLMVSKVKSTLTGYLYRPAKYRYTCPDLRVTYTLDGTERNQDSVLQNTIAGMKLWSPLPEDIVVVDQPRPAIIADSNVVDNNRTLLNDFAARKNVVQQEIRVNSDSVRISFYDNGDIDGDSISVFLNGQPVISRMELDAKGLNLYIKLDSSRMVNEISMFAENLGKYPPNTALMVVHDGENRSEVYLSSSLSQNAVVRIRKK